MPLPDLPPRADNVCEATANYLRQHGPSTIPQIVGTDDTTVIDTMRKFLNRHLDKFAKVAEVKNPVRGQALAVWTVKEKSK